MKVSKNKTVASYGDWRVLTNGEIINDKRAVRIVPDRLRESDWWSKLHFGKTWMADEWNSFIPAWAKACELAGIKEINIKIEL
jgi:hypothetical protein